MNSLAKKNIIFFDFDGTIADTMKHYFYLYNKFAKENNKLIIDEEDYEELRSKSFNEVRKILGLSFCETFFIAKKLKKELYENPFSIKIIPGIIDVINALHKKNVFIYIVSSNKKKYIQKVLVAHEINHIEKIITTFRGFNKTYFVKKYLKKNKNYTHAFLISDEYKDIKTANKLGMISLAVTWGANDFIHNQQVTPHYMLSKPSQILPVLDQYI